MDSTFSDFWSGLNPVKMPISMIDMLVFALSRYLQIKNNKENLLGRQVTAADPGFFSGGGAPLRDGVTDRWRKQILKASMKKAFD